MKDKAIDFETGKLAFEIGITLNSAFGNCEFWTPSGREGYINESHIYQFDGYPRVSQSLLQKYLREKHGVSVLVDLDITLSWIWKIQPLHPEASIQKYLVSNEVWCGKYEQALEAGLIAAMNIIKENKV